MQIHIRFLQSLLELSSGARTRTPRRSIPTGSGDRRCDGWGRTVRRTRRKETVFGPWERFEPGEY
jgi:hypothetical protein